MKYEGKLKLIAEKLNIAGFDKMSLTEKAEACKKATGKDSISDAFDYVQKGGKAVSKVATEAGKVIDQKGVEYIPPQLAQVAHKVDVAAPQFNVTIPMPGIKVNTDNLAFGHVVRQSLLWLNGVAVGGMAVALFFMYAAMRHGVVVGALAP